MYFNTYNFDRSSYINAREQIRNESIGGNGKIKKFKKFIPFAFDPSIPRTGTDRIVMHPMWSSAESLIKLIAAKTFFDAVKWSNTKDIASPRGKIDPKNSTTFAFTHVHETGEMQEIANAWNSGSVYNYEDRTITGTGELLATPYEVEIGGVETPIAPIPALQIEALLSSLANDIQPPILKYTQKSLGFAGLNKYRPNPGYGYIAVNGLEFIARSIRSFIAELNSVEEDGICFVSGTKLIVKTPTRWIKLDQGLWEVDALKTAAYVKSNPDGVEVALEDYDYWQWTNPGGDDSGSYVQTNVYDAYNAFNSFQSVPAVTRNMDEEITEELLPVTTVEDLGDNTSVTTVSTKRREAYIADNMLLDVDTADNPFNSADALYLSLNNLVTSISGIYGLMDVREVPDPEVFVGDGNDVGKNLIEVTLPRYKGYYLSLSLLIKHLEYLAEPFSEAYANYLTVAEEGPITRYLDTMNNLDNLVYSWSNRPNNRTSYIAFHVKIAMHDGYSPWREGPLATDVTIFNTLKKYFSMAELERVLIPVVRKNAGTTSDQYILHGYLINWIGISKLSPYKVGLLLAVCFGYMHTHTKEAKKKSGLGSIVKIGIAFVAALYTGGWAAWVGFAAVAASEIAAYTGSKTWGKIATALAIVAAVMGSYNALRGNMNALQVLNYAVSIATQVQRMMYESKFDKLMSQVGAINEEIDDIQELLTETDQIEKVKRFIYGESINNTYSYVYDYNYDYKYV